MKHNYHYLNYIKMRMTCLFNVKFFSWHPCRMKSVYLLIISPNANSWTEFVDLSMLFPILWVFFCLELQLLNPKWFISQSDSILVSHKMTKMMNLAFIWTEVVWYGSHWDVSGFMYLFWNVLLQITWHSKWIRANTRWAGAFWFLAGDRWYRTALSLCASCIATQRRKSNSVMSLWLCLGVQNVSTTSLWLHILCTCHTMPHVTDIALGNVSWHRRHLQNLRTHHCDVCPSACPNWDRHNGLWLTQWLLN